MSVDASARRLGGERTRAPDSPLPPWSENRPAGGWSLRVDVRQLWAYRELAILLALRDLKLRYKQTVFGVAWAVIQPVAAALVFGLFLGRLTGVPSDGYPYMLFVLVALVPWVYVSNGVTAAAQSLAEHQALVTKVYFPRLLAPIAAILPGLLDLAIALVVVAVVMVFTGIAPGPELLTLPVWILAAVLVAAAVGIWMAALNALYRDVRFAMTFLLQVWLFASPVVYPSSLVHGQLREAIFALNPMVGVIDGFRWAILGDHAPGVTDLPSLVVTCVLLLGGIAYFVRVERSLADRI